MGRDVPSAFSTRGNRTSRAAVVASIICCTATGCGMGMSREFQEAQSRAVADMRDISDAQERMQERMRLQQEMMSNPDLAPWHTQRERMSLAIGDRQFDKSFDRVFDSMTIALASLGCRVQNMERASGYITASIPELPPAQREALRQEQMRQYAVAKGYPPTIFDKTGTRADDFDFDYGAMMDRGWSGLTLSMVRQGPEVTKVKLRFDNVYYPKLVEEYYRIVWAAVDKQIFLDKALD